MRGIERAAEDGAQLVVLELDTPGGLDASMRRIVKAILASQVPVAGFVAPSGARAASAGTYILYACHIAAMAPGTNLGAATPVRLGTPDKPAEKPPARDAEPMARKQVNDAAAYIRGLAQLRGRNVEWAERAVREAVSLAAHEAAAQRVIALACAGVLLAPADMAASSSSPPPARTVAALPAVDDRPPPLAPVRSQAVAPAYEAEPPAAELDREQAIQFMQMLRDEGDPRSPPLGGLQPRQGATAQELADPKQYQAFEERQTRELVQAYTSGVQQIPEIRARIEADRKSVV